VLFEAKFSQYQPYNLRSENLCRCGKACTLADVLRNRDARTILIKLDIEGMEIEALESYVPDEDRAVCIVGELHDHRSNSQILARIFSSKGWTVRFEQETDQGSIFHAYSPAARSMLGHPSGSQIGC
jgi:hypothetical protein